MLLSGAYYVRQWHHARLYLSCEKCWAAVNGVSDSVCDRVWLIRQEFAVAALT
jgi:hypothetical protein